MARWFRCGLSVAGPFVCRCLTSPTMLRFHSPLIEPDGRISRIRLSDKTHAFAHGKLRVRVIRRTSPSTSCRWASENLAVPIPRTLCLAHSHWRSRVAGMPLHDPIGF